MKNIKNVGMKVSMLALAVLLLAGIYVGAAGAVPVEEWNRTFGGAYYDYANSVRQTKDGGYIIAGETHSYKNSKDDGDAWLIKTNSSGNQQWNKTFGGIGWDSAQSVQQTLDGGYIIAGYTYSYGAGHSDAWLIKTDSNGNQIWSKTFGGASNESAQSVQQTSDGGYIIAGWTTPFGYRCGLLIKTYANGDELWNKTLCDKSGFGIPEWANSVKQTSDGGYIIAGGFLQDALLIKTDSNGNEILWRKFGGTGFEEGTSVQQTSDGGYVIAGETNSYGAGNSDAWLIKTDSGANQQWNKTFGGTAGDGANSVQQTSDGGYIIAGYTDSYFEGGIDDLILKTDSSGNEQWRKTFRGTHADWAASVQQTKDGGYVLAGSTSHYNGTRWGNAWLIKVTTSAPIDSTTGKGRVYIDTSIGSIENLVAVKVSDIPKPPPPGAILDYGLFRFEITNIPIGGSVILTFTFPANLPPNTKYWKYGAEPTNAVPHWYYINPIIDGNKLMISLTDGGRGDDDITANGRIKDDGGPAMLADIQTYYRIQGNDPYIVETTDLLTAADDWSYDIAVPEFGRAIATQELLSLADEWSRSG